MSKIKVKVVPAQGKTKTVTLEATGAPLRDVLMKGGYDASNFEVKKNGKSADLSSYVSDGDEVSLTERVKGS